MSDLDALMHERAGYQRRGLPDRVAAVNAEIKRLGGSVPAEKPADASYTDPSDPPIKRSRKPSTR